MRNLLIGTALMLSLAGCPGLAVKTPSEGVAACYATVKATWNLAGDLKVRGKLDASQQKSVLALGDQAIASCDAARTAVVAGDVTTAQGKLKAAESVLLQLETWQKQKGGQ